MYQSQPNVEAAVHAQLLRFNASQRAYAVAGNYSHYDQTGPITLHSKPFPAVMVPATVAHDSDDLASAIVIANALKIAYNAHIAEALDLWGAGVHAAADTTNVVSTAIATNIATAVTLINAIKAAFNAHLSQSGVHGHDDSTNVVSTDDAVAVDDPENEIVALDTVTTLTNDLAAAFNAHRASAPGGHMIRLASP